MCFRIVSLIRHSNVEGDLYLKKKKIISMKSWGFTLEEDWLNFKDKIDIGIHFYFVFKINL